MSQTFTYNRCARFREITPAALAWPRTPGALAVGSRMPALVGARQRADAAFRKRKVVVIGTGSVGRRIALHVARLGVSALWLVDPGRYDDPANLVTQEVLRADINNDWKAASAGRACKGISPQTRVYVYLGRVQELDPVLLSDADFLFLATDNLTAEVDVAQIAIYLRTPLVQAAVHGETLVAQVRFVANRDARGPCLACVFGPEEWAHAERQTVFSCNGPGGRPTERTKAIPTMSPSFLCSASADFAMMQWTRHVLGLGEPVEDTILQHCGYTHRITQAPLKRNEQCPCEHLPLRRVPASHPLGKYTPRRLLEAARFAISPDVSLVLGDLVYVESAICCGIARQIDGFVGLGDKVGCCAVCGGGLSPQPFYSHRRVSCATLARHFDVPFEQLGAMGAAWAIIRGPGEGVLLK